MYKWLATRPLQGLVFGAVTYFVLTSGLMAIRGSDQQTPDLAVLVLCFLAAFSDRFSNWCSPR